MSNVSYNPSPDVLSQQLAQVEYPSTDATPHSFGPELDSNEGNNLQPSLVAAEHSKLIVGLSELIKLFGGLLSTPGQQEATVVFTAGNVQAHRQTLSQALNVVASTHSKDKPVFKCIVPLELCNPTLFSRVAATIDMRKIRLLISTSKLSLTDLNSYAI
ncbi:hypothetical protein BY996DRAFT_6461116 [Phakopsora pachyrhizi]|nr:hypothetical protein BY996DRAFT_6461116 [Phakopsora pachyrhizi]